MIAIRIVSRQGVAVPESPAASFGESGGLIGRGEDCELVLPDAERHLSRRQLRISCRNGRYFMRVLSASAPVKADGTDVPVDTEHPLDDGTAIQVGPYLLQVVSARPDSLAVQEVDLVVGDPTGESAQVAGAPSGNPAGQAANQVTPPAEISQDLVASLYAGLGRPLPAQLEERHLRLVGELLRASVQGLLALLAVRSIAKRELGADPTLPQIRENNPLKFSPDVDTALAHLLGPPHRGFLAPRAAVDNAFGDLRAHEVALLAGMRAAVDAVLARFDPEVLRQRLAPKAKWQQLLPAARKAELWESYEQGYAQIVEEIEGDFDSLFNRAFLKAYREQLAQLAPGAAAPGRKVGNHD
jgi:predicted component of type VI protein secretion system